jgi:hypothetical protein
MYLSGGWAVVVGYVWGTTAAEGVDWYRYKNLPIDGEMKTRKTLGMKLGERGVERTSGVLLVASTALLWLEAASMRLALFVGNLRPGDSVRFEMIG